MPKNMPKQFYREVRKLILDSSHLLNSKEEVLKRWTEHFNTLLNVNRSADLQNISLMPQLPLSTELDEPLTLDEVVTAIRQQKNKRAAGIDHIPSELLKCGGKDLHTSVWKLFVRMWEEGESQTILNCLVLVPGVQEQGGPIRL